MASKRKRNVPTLEKKLEIIGDMKKGKSVWCVSGSKVHSWRYLEGQGEGWSASDCPSFAKKRHIAHVLHLVF